MIYIKIIMVISNFLLLPALGLSYDRDTKKINGSAVAVSLLSFANIIFVIFS